MLFCRSASGITSFATCRHFSGKRVLAMGNTIMDMVLTMKRFPVDDKVWVDSKKVYVGGQGANAAQDMALLGLDVSFVTRIGDDGDGKIALEHYRSMGIDTSHCIVVPGAQTMSACVVIETDTERRACLMHKEEKMFDFDTAAHLDRIDMSKFDCLYTDGHQTDIVLPVVKRAVQAGLPILSDVEVLTEETRLLASLASELIAPVACICSLANESDPGIAVTNLANKRKGLTVVATCGSDGSYGARHGDNKATFVAAEKCNVVDTVGAGDAFHAGFCVATARGYKDLADVMTFATKVSACLVETPGPVVSREALQRRSLLP